MDSETFWLTSIGADGVRRGRNPGEYDTPAGCLVFAATETAMRKLLQYWEGLAHQCDGGRVQPPLRVTESGALDRICEWANAVRWASTEGERAVGTYPPMSNVTDAGDDLPRVVTLAWMGTWTQGRWIKVEITEGVDGIPSIVGLSWHTATSAPSRFLNIGGLMEALGTDDLVQFTA